ncbi:MAG TPA: hypothetical protein DDW52_06700, partial [Planctomycetaceae bacterium]|nr:hypothetical protein [Planctomycetaceae bacterium]
AISTDARSHDFGSVARAAKTEHRFVITNPLDEAIHLRSVRASCGCTTPIIETKTIPPGGTGTILARFNTGTFTGNKSATLTVSIDKPFWTEIQLRVKGYIRSDIVINPGEANFGEVTEGEPKQLDLDLVYAGRSDWQLTKITSPNEFVKVDFEETGRGGGQVRYKIKATITDDAPIGDLHKQLVLHTNDRRITSVPLRLLANVRKDGIQTSVDNFKLGTVEEGQQVSKRLVVKAKEAFRILEISSDIIDVEFEPSDKPKAVHLVNINMKPNQRGGGKFDGSLFVKTDLEDEIAKLGLSFELASQHSVLKPAAPVQVPVSKNED